MKKLEPVAESSHIGVWSTLQFVALWNHLDRPAVQWCLQPGLEAEVEVSGMLGIKAEGIS